MSKVRFSKENISKFYCEKKLIESPYFKGDNPLKMLIASDIHYHPHVDKELYEILVAYCRQIKPDFIIMPGDQIETIDFIDDQKEKGFFESIIRDMSEVAPVIIIPGNHEIGFFRKENFFKRLSGESSNENIKSLKFFESLNRFNNVYFLNNEQTSIKGMTFLGFNPRLATYLKKGNEATNDMFIEDYLKSGLKMAEADYNVLLTHSPIILSDSHVLSSVQDFNSLTDLVVTGHLHDGYLPKSLDKYLGNTGAGLFFTPLVAPFPGMICRGVHDFGRGYLFVSQGFRKWTADMKLFNAFEKITANDVEELFIINPNAEIADKNLRR